MLRLQTRSMHSAEKMRQSALIKCSANPSAAAVLPLPHLSPGLRCHSAALQTDQPLANQPPSSSFSQAQVARAECRGILRGEIPSSYRRRRHHLPHFQQPSSPQLGILGQSSAPMVHSILRSGLARDRRRIATSLDMRGASAIASRPDPSCPPLLPHSNLTPRT